MRKKILQAAVLVLLVMVVKFTIIDPWSGSTKSDHMVGQVDSVSQMVNTTGGPVIVHDRGATFKVVSGSVAVRK